MNILFKFPNLYPGTKTTIVLKQPKSDDTIRDVDVLYYSFLSPQQLRNVEEIIEKLRPHIRDISFRTYYRRRREPIDALSSILWGYTSKDSIDILEKLFPDDKDTGEQK